jgi:hypothetical protein
MPNFKILRFIVFPIKDFILGCNKSKSDLIGWDAEISAYLDNSEHMLY